MISNIVISVFEYLLNCSFLTLGLTILTVLIFLRMLTRTHKNLPPGPSGFPIVGYYPFLGKETFKDFQKLGKKYGNVMGLYLGTKYTVIVNDFTLAKEALSKPAFLGKPPHSVFNLLPDGVGVSSVNGEPWVEQRRFTSQILKNLGMGSRDLEIHIHEEISGLLNIIEAKKGKPFFILSDLLTSVSNIIWYLLFGQLLKSEDLRKKQLEEGLYMVTKMFDQSSVLAFVPFLKNVLKFFKSKQFQENFKVLNTFNKLMREQVEIRRKNPGLKDSEDFIEKYMQEMKTRQKVDKNTSFNETNLLGNLQGFFIGGSETTTTTLTWAFLLMAAFPELQKRIYDDIVDKFGKDRQISWTDKSLIPLVESFLMETQRWKTVAPVGGLRYTLEDASIGGYFIPKNTTILFNFWSIHHDPAYWEEPDSFKPERFLNKEKNAVVKPPFYMPFSLGKRNCPGEVLSIIEAFLFFTSVVQKFEIKMPEGVKAIVDKHDLGLTLAPMPQELCYIQRT